MKKNIFIIMILFAFFACIVTVAAATVIPPAEVNQKDNCIIFGSYRQNYYNSIEAIDRVEPGDEPLEWLILKRDGTKLFLVSKYPLDYKQFSEKKGKFTWKNSTIRNWLNVTFYNKAFTADEKKAILTVDVESGAENIDEKWPVAKKETTQDKIFLLSYAEMKRYLNDDKVTLDGYLEMVSGGIFTTDDTWWLRSSGKKEDEVFFAGHSKKESGWLTDWRCIRPAMWIDTSLYDWNDSPYVKYQKAAEYAKSNKYPEAFAITDTLDNYWGSRLTSAQYRLAYAKEAFDSKDFSTAIDRYKDLKEYISLHFPVKNELHDADEKAILLRYFAVGQALLESRYQLAIQKKEAGDIATAISMLSEIGQYKNSMQYLRECFDKSHIQYSWLTGPDDTVNTGLNNGYKENNMIDGNDPHFGWQLGRFMISGFTEEKKESGRRVFMKTPGDNLILWFDLQQNIDALNNDKNLTINNDTDGMDVRLNYGKQKNGFGRGLLLIRHTDFRNSTTDPQAYTNS